MDAKWLGDEQYAVCTYAEPSHGVPQVCEIVIPIEKIKISAQGGSWDDRLSPGIWD
jgi:hypothetical protein